MKKSLIILGIIIAVIIILFVIKSLTKSTESDSDYLEKYLKDNNYELKDDVYVKTVSDDDDLKDVTNIDDYDKEVLNKNAVEYTTLSLEKDEFAFEKLNRTYDEDVEKIYNGIIYLKKNNKVEFEYMINIYTTQIMVRGSYELNGEYSDDNYDCSLYYQSGLEENQDESERTYCLLAKAETLDFIKDINDLKEDKRIYSIIKE